MNLDPDLCYRAVRSRDRRFDGRFFTAVVTTGVYCRPVCPAPTPRRRNVRFFPCASAAEEAGFRACLRCRPESSPGTPAWSGASATVSRALRLIAGGALDGGDLEGLSTRLGIGERQLRRLFSAELGTSPVAVAQTRRAHFARRRPDAPPREERNLGRLFPRAAVLAGADLASIGIPRSRAEAIRALARAVRDGDLLLDAGGGAGDPVERLREIPGIGEWTAGYVAMRALGEPDAYPAGDLGLRSALASLEGHAPSPKEVARRAENWRPWRAYAALLLWTGGASENAGRGRAGAPGGATQRRRQ